MLVAPHRRTDPAAAARLRAEVARDLQLLDEAARGWTRLGTDLPPTRVRVVSRGGWVKANLAGLRGALDPLHEKIAGRPLASGAIGVQLGGLLGLLSTKVLGQYVLPLGGPGQGQLVLVGPNVLELSDRYGTLAADVRRTVMLHEITHRLQFDGTPWLGDHLRGLLTRYLEASRIDPAALVEVLNRVPHVLRQLREDPSVTPLLQLVLTEEQLAIVEEAQSLMTLLEGHGNAAMYGAAEGLVEDPAAMREALERRRSDLATRILSAVAGLEMKKRQYREGEAFVREVVERVGTEGLNRAFERPANLPHVDELDDPDAWIGRVGARNGV
jgi:coenzyme F420 biosynthesis associated uncharacterized protein